MHSVPHLFGDEQESEHFHKEIRKGFLKAILLTIIREKPIHGYDLIQQIKEKSGGRWTPSPGSVYPALEYLESRGYIMSQEMERKKVYTITPRGEQAIEQMKQLRKEMLRDITAFFGNL